MDWVTTSPVQIWPATDFFPDTFDDVTTLFCGFWATTRFCDAMATGVTSVLLEIWMYDGGRGFVGRMEATFKIGVTVAAASGITVVTRVAGVCDVTTGVMLRDRVGCPPCMIHLAELKSIWDKF